MLGIQSSMPHRTEETPGGKLLKQTPMVNIAETRTSPSDPTIPPISSLSSESLSLRHETASISSALQTAASLGTSLRSSSALPPSIVHILQLTAQTTNTMDACTSAQLFPILEPRTNHFHQTSTSIIQTIKETISSLPPGAL